MPREIRDGYTVGKTTRKGQPVEHTVHAVCTVVESRELGQVLGCFDPVEVRRHLRRLRAEGILVAKPGRLQAKVRREDGSKVRCYVFACRSSDIPTIGRPRKRARVISL